MYEKAKEVNDKCEPTGLKLSTCDQITQDERKHLV